MIVIYRACSVGTSKKRPIEDKIELVRICFNSFRDAFKGVKHDLIVLLDKPNQALRNIFEGINKREEFFYPSFDEGNTGTFHRQIEIALERKDQFFFVEDDYYFLPESGRKIVEALKHFDFLTPYDHPGYYREKIHKYKRDIKLIGDQHWQTVISTTLTFAGKYGVLREEFATMQKYGWADHPMWCDITKRYKLWSPIPTLATHMEKPHLSPCVDWAKIFENVK